MIMEHQNRLRVLRAVRGWSQAELAELAGISRTAVSAIEMNRLVPSVATALALASVLETTVERLFGNADHTLQTTKWAWQPVAYPCRFWQARLGRRMLRYPIETFSFGMVHDGICKDGQITLHQPADPNKTLVIASCDPAAGLLAVEFARATGFRLIVLQRSSRAALQMLQAGLIHAAGIHFATPDSPDGNVREVKALANQGYQLLRLADWQEGLVLASGNRMKSIDSVLRGRLRWVGREPGSAAQECLQELLPARRMPDLIAYHHRGVADAVRSGWGDVGLCHQLVAAELGLQFLPVRQEAFDLCYPTNDDDDPRIQALKQFVRSPRYRQLWADLPGIDTRHAGELRIVER